MTANTAESLLREFARKRTNKGRAAEELAKSAATLILPQRRAANAVSVRIKEAADTAESDCGSWFSQADQQRLCCCRGACKNRCCRSDVPGARI